MRNQIGRSGFTVMEILVAMVLLAAVAASALSSFTSATRITQPRSGIAQNIARGYLEQFYEYVRQDQYAAATPTPISTPPAPPPLTQTLDGTTYTTAYTVTAAEQNGDAQEDYRRVRMTVSW